MHTGLLILGVALLPVIALWINSESLFLLLQQPPCVVRLSSQFLGVFTLMLPVSPSSYVHPLTSGSLIHSRLPSILSRLLF